MKYADAIILLRRRMLLTQDEFTKYIGVSFGSVNRWENEQYNSAMKLKRKLAPMFKEYKIEVEE